MSDVTINALPNGPYLVKGPVTPSVTGTWLFVLGIIALLLLSAVWLKSCHHIKAASVLLFIMALPGIIYLALMLAINVFRIKL